MTPEEIALRIVDRMWIHSTRENALGVLTEELKSALAASEQRFKEESQIIDRCWKALGIATYEQAGGRAIDEIIADNKDKVRELEEKLKRYETPEYHVRHNCCTAVEASEQRGKADGCGPHHNYRGDPVDCEEYERLVGAVDQIATDAMQDANISHDQVSRLEREIERLGNVRRTSADLLKRLLASERALERVREALIEGKAKSSLYPSRSAEIQSLAISDALAALASPESPQ